MGYGTMRGSDIVGQKRYELSNHLNNVLEVISDRKWAKDDGIYNLATGAQTSSTPDGLADYYLPVIVAYTDYDPYGTAQTGRKGGISDYRYGFQGQEMDDEIKGEGNSINYEYRMHDPRLGRFFAVDPLAAEYPWYTPYQFSGNKLIDHVELEGLEEIKYDIAGGQNFIGGGRNGDAVDPDAYNTAFQRSSGNGGIVIGLGLALMGPTWALRYLGEELLEEALGFPIIPDPGDAIQSAAKKSVKASNPNPLKVLPTDDLAAKVTKRKQLTYDHYRRAGFEPSKIDGHAAGIDFSKPVFTKTYEKGTVLDQWTYLDDAGNPKMGNYYTLPGADPQKLGLPLEGRVKTTVVLNEDTKFLQSTTATIENWNKPGSGEMLQGGETQLFQTNVKYEIVQ
jgi:RHS repeat-associated protein